MAARMKAAANRIPTTVSSTVGMTDQSYLLLSPLEASYGLDKTSGKQTKSYLQYNCPFKLSCILLFSFAAVL